MTEKERALLLALADAFAGKRVFIYDVQKLAQAVRDEPAKRDCQTVNLNQLHYASDFGTL